MNADAARRDPPHAPRASSGPTSSRAGKKRVRHFTADDRAAHREFEKGRRKAFRERLTELASHIPALSNVEPQKLSKHVVVEESITRHEQLEASCVDALGMIQALANEREELLAEVNTWRAGAGLPPHERTASASTQGLASIEANPQNYPCVDYAGSSTPEANADCQPPHVARDQLGDTHYAHKMAPATDIIDGTGLPDNDLVSVWSLMDAQGVPVMPTSDAFHDASHGQDQQTLPTELGMF